MRSIITTLLKDRERLQRRKLLYRWRLRLSEGLRRKDSARRSMITERWSMLSTTSIIRRNLSGTRRNSIDQTRSRP